MHSFLFKLFSVTPFNFLPFVFHFPDHIFQARTTHDLFELRLIPTQASSPRIVNVPLVSSQMAPPFSFSAWWSVTHLAAFPKQFNFLLCFHQPWIFSFIVSPTLPWRWQTDSTRESYKLSWLEVTWVSLFTLTWVLSFIYFQLHWACLNTLQGLVI